LGDDVRIPVGTHYRVWWFWLPIIVGGLAFLAAAVTLPIVPPVGVLAGSVCVLCAISATLAGFYIERGRRWVEVSDDNFRLSDRNVQTLIRDEQVTDLALHRQPHHGAGKLLAETRHLICWIDTEAGTRKITLNSRLAPGAPDPLQPLIDRLRRRLGERALHKLAAREAIDGDGWALDATQLHIADKRQRTSIPLEDLCAVETIGQEVRVWEHANPYTIARLPLSARNTWLLERLLAQRLAVASSLAASGSVQHVNGRGAAHPVREVLLTELPPSASRPSPLGRILFERTVGTGPTIMFGVMAMLLASVGGLSLWVALPARDPIMSAVGGLLLLLSGLCFVGGWRVRRVRFRCYERGLERVSMTGRKLLPFDDIDVFSFENRRNHSQGRYTGTTYTLVFADRSREQGRGIFYSTTVRNHDVELEDLRERVSQVIARRMAQTFATHRSVQWTPEVWFRRDALEYNRRRRLFVPTRVAVIPYDTISDFELRDGLLHIWTSYQERAVLSLSSGTPNFYPGLILLEGLARATQRNTPQVRVKN
jgi:hypothetical protein